MTHYATPWRGVDSTEAARAAAARTAQKARDEAQRFSEWRKPTGHTQGVIRVGAGELTCLRCGETFGVTTVVSGEHSFCWRCGGHDGVLTTSYLQPHEYREVR